MSALDPFIDKLIDWRDFERFVRDLYAEDADLTVEHNVTEVGRSGARRQIDVKISQTVEGVSQVTLAECKRWKEKVSRDRVDILFAGIDDLEATKGVIFTTKGYEAGAEAYAKSKEIDLFVVRDLTDSEWGLPGREIWFYFHIYAARIENVDFDAYLMATVPNPPTSLNLDIRIDKGSPDPGLVLHSVTDGTAGPNLIDLLLEGRDQILRALATSIRLFDDGDEAQKALRIPVVIDLSTFPYREIPKPYGSLRLDGVRFNLLAVVNQSRFSFDRGHNLDLALAVENYVTSKRRVVTRSAESAGLLVVPLADADGEAKPADETILENGVLLQVFTEPWVDVGSISREIVDLTPVRLKPPDWRIEANGLSGLRSDDATGKSVQ